MAIKYDLLASRQRNAVTPINEPIRGRESEQTLNPAGAYSFKANEWDRLNRFLITGVSGNTIYQSQGDLVKQNADNIVKLLAEDGIRVVDAAATVLRERRAIKPDAALFVLAMASSPAHSKLDNVRNHALQVAPEVISIPTHLFMFVEYAQSMRGWGRGLRRSVARYYTETAIPKLAMHSWKYKSRDGWSHRDVIALSHAETKDPARNRVMNYMISGIPSKKKDVGDDAALLQIVAAEKLLHAETSAKAIKLITKHRLTREAVPTRLLNDPAVWEALLQEMPVMAMVRNLGKMSSLNMLGPFSDASQLVVQRLNDADRISRSGIHPMTILMAAKQYSQGNGHLGKLSWTPSQHVLDALDAAFYLAFDNVEVSGKRILLAGDDSGSMCHRRGPDLMTAAEAAAAMMFITHVVEPNTHMIGYSGDYREIPVSRNTRVVDLLRYFGRGGMTDTTLPIRYVADKKLDVDAIVSYTDNCTWSGNYYGSRNGHVTEVLRDYQNTVGHAVRFVNVSMEANNITDVDPGNPNMFEIAGLSTDTPRLISEFIAGRI